MKRISDNDWRKIELYADLFQLCIVSERNDKEPGNETNLFIKRATHGIIPKATNINSHDLHNLDQTFTKIDGNSQLGIIMSPKIRKYLK